MTFKLPSESSSRPVTKTYQKYALGSEAEVRNFKISMGSASSSNSANSATPRSSRRVLVPSSRPRVEKASSHRQGAVESQAPLQDNAPNYRYGSTLNGMSSKETRTALIRPLPSGPGPRPHDSSLSAFARGPLKADHSIKVRDPSPSTTSRVASSVPLRTLAKSKGNSSSLCDLRETVHERKAFTTSRTSPRAPVAVDSTTRREFADHLMLKVLQDQAKLGGPIATARSGDRQVFPRSQSFSALSSKDCASLKDDADSGYSSKRSSLRQSITDLHLNDVSSESRRRREQASRDSVSASSAGSGVDLSSATVLTRRLSTATLNETYTKGLNGLKNLGNTCFMNCILQCLCKTKFLRAYFCKDTYKSDLNDSHLPTRGKLATAFAELMSEMWLKSSSASISPTQLRQQVVKVASRFAGYSQQDCQEFLRFFIEGLHDDLNSVKQKPVFSTLEDDSMSDKVKSDVSWGRYLQREKSIIQDVFVGQLRSTLTCCACGHRSVTYDPFWDLSLPIPSRSRTFINEVGVDHCLRVFTQEEVLDGDEKPICGKCKKRKKSTKRFLIERFPQVLVLHLKRFSPGSTSRKLDVMVLYPHELNLKDFASSNCNAHTDPIYTLYGVSNHSGTAYGGHYTAFCKHPDSGLWHEYNDSSVREIQKSEAISRDGYVLFYELRNHKAVL